MTSTEKRTKFIEMFGSLIEHAKANNIKFIITSYFRTATEQFALYQKGLSQLDGTKRKSAHQLWLAFDIAVVKPDGGLTFDDVPEYKTLGEFWESLGGTWGGRWKSLNDIYHFEYKENANE